MRPATFTIQSAAPFKLLSISDTNGGSRDLPVPGGSAKIVTLLLRDSERTGPLGVAIGLVSGDLKSMRVDDPNGAADFGDPLAMKVPTIVYELGAVAAGIVIAWLLLADRKRGRK